MEINQTATTNGANSEETPDGKDFTTDFDCTCISLNSIDGNWHSLRFENISESNETQTQNEEDPRRPGKTVITLVLVVRHYSVNLLAILRITAESGSIEVNIQFEVVMNW